MDVAYLADGHISFKSDYPIPELEPQQVLLEVLLTGVCGTDLALARGYAGYQGVPGHEFVARVVKLGSQVDTSWLDQRVTAEINQFCGRCSFCSQRQFSHCEQRRVIGIRHHQGSFARYLAVNANTLHAIPDELDDREAVFIEPLAAAYRIVEQLTGVNYQTVLIVGAGRLGQLIARVMATTAKNTAVVIRHEQQRCLLSDVNVHTLTEDEVSACHWDVVIEASGNISGLDLALSAVRSGGHIILKSTYLERPQLPLQDLVINEITLLGSRCGPFDQAIKGLLNKHINVLPLIDSEYPLKNVEKAMSHAGSVGTMKVMIRP